MQKSPIPFVILVAFLILSGLPVTAQQQSHYPSRVEEQIKQVEHSLFSWVRIKGKPDWTIAERMAFYKVNGLSLAVIKDYKIEWTKAYGWADTAERQPVTPATLFQAASIGKSLHALGCLKLVEEGKISLDADINDYLRSWQFPYDTASQNQKISLSRLLSHTAGLSVHGYDGYKVGAALPNLFQIVNGKSPANSPAVRSEFAPGLKFQYSGGGYEISELMVEDQTGLSYGEYMKKRVFGPLRMRNTTYELVPSGRFKKRLATAYRSDGQSIGSKYHLYPEKACGAGLWSTAEDIARFVIGVQLALKGEPDQILSPQMARQMVSPPGPDSTYGYGVFLEKRGGVSYFQHSGLNEGFSSQYFGSMEGGNGVVVLVNSDNTRFAQEVINSVATVYGWKGFAPFSQKTAIALSEEELSKFVGKYQFKGNPEDYVSVVLKKGALYLKDPQNGTEWEILFSSPTDSYMREARWVDQVFSKDNTGKITGFHIIGGGMKQWAAKVE
ncbi:serine hydrolase domain-containing protein [Rufibacter aurantiacus]|uniref:serine hydrolase domain-containing protein n=1 Tax=Rufibacter aurantiacus TaxID=2817374 RepID=UPI001B30F1BF|nr:serine hydrolase domain-containing protein [Rufibacter aurantiacus]